ncbi:MAG: AMP-binding protein [Caulobacterales bacterium]
MRLADTLRLRGRLRTSQRLAHRRLWDAAATVALADVAYGTALGGALPALAGRSVLVRTVDMLSAALAMIELDGVARRLVLCPPDLKDEDLPHVIATAGVDAVVFDRGPPATGEADLIAAALSLPPAPLRDEPTTGRNTEWVMFTSGTTGVPKMVIHSLAGLTGAIKQAGAADEPPVWGTFYDIRRFGGLQILLRALLGEGSMVLAQPGEPVAPFLARLGRHGVTHLTGTPSHWRRVLMSPAAGAISPRYIRLSGEIADQAVLDGLKAAYPGVPIGHAYASTEAGVGFEVTDGLEGFPAILVERCSGEVRLRVVDGALQLRSERAASCYLGENPTPVAGADGFVDTGDMVERQGDRFRFVGRRGGIINVGGLKVHPEEIEAVINGHPAVLMSLVRGRRNPITGAIVVADVVLNGEGGPHAPAADTASIKAEILSVCRRNLAPFKVPTGVRFVGALDMTAGGKLERAGA